jgi:hypothetical protein
MDSSVLQSLICDLDREKEYAKTVSPLYGAVFQVLHESLVRDAGGFASDIEGLWAGRSVTAWFERPLLLAAALHRVVRSGRAPQLAAFYGTCGGLYKPAQFNALRAALLTLLHHEREDFMRRLQEQTLQTNEISRGITWLYVLSDRWRKRPTAVGLFEIGCSAGLNMIADEYGWDIQSAGRSQVKEGDPAVRIELVNESGRPHEPVLAAMADIGASIKVRHGCDLNVPDVRLDSDREMLEAMIWGDNPARLRRLQAAMIRLARHRDEGRLSLVADDAIEQVQIAAMRLAERLQPGDLVCFYNTVVTCYFDDAAYARLRAEIERAFAGTLSRQRGLWIEHEPARETESTSAIEDRFDSLVRLSELDGAGSLKTRTVAGTEMHPAKFVWLAGD